MARKKLIDRKYIQPVPIQIPTWLTYVTALHYWGAPGWVWGVAGTIIVCAQITLIHGAITTDSVHPSDVPRDDKRL